MTKNDPKPEICQKTEHFDAKNCHFGAILPKKPFFTKIGQKSQSRGFRGLGFLKAKNGQT